jgi:uncharacterized membrane protein (Fun14 family)
MGSTLIVVLLLVVIIILGLVFLSTSGFIQTKTGQSYNIYGETTTTTTTVGGHEVYKQEKTDSWLDKIKNIFGG